MWILTELFKKKKHPISSFLPQVYKLVKRTLTGVVDWPGGEYTFRVKTSGTHLGLGWATTWCQLQFPTQ